MQFSSMSLSVCVMVMATSVAGCELSRNCEGLVYNESLNTCECPEGSEPDYDVDACVFPNGDFISWVGLDVPYLDPDAGFADASDDFGSADLGSGDQGTGDMGMDAGMTDAGPDANVPAPANAQARYPWNGLTTGSIHVREDELVVNHPLRPKFMWEETDGADHYQIQLTRACALAEFRSCDFARVDLDETTSETTFFPSASLPVARTVPVGSRYFWRMRACSVSENCSDWTEVRYLDVGRDDHDVNGDGYADVVVGAPGNGERARAGAAYVYFGSVSGVSDEPDITITSPTPMAGELFASSLSYGGDINGDGYTDLLVSPSTAAGVFEGPGIVYVYNGARNGPGASPNATLASPVIGAIGFGRFLSAAGDFDGDGYADVLVQTYRPGAAFIFLGSASGLSIVRRVSLPDLTGPSLVFPSALGSIGDSDGDGFVDVAVGSKTARTTPGGQVFLFYGRQTALEARTLVITNPLAQPGLFGSQIAGGGDIDGDGFSDFLVSEDAQELVYVFRGGLEIDTAPTTLTTPGVEAGRFGRDIGRAGDVNGDGFDDFAIAAPFENHEEEDEGRVYFYNGAADILPVPTEIANPSSYPQYDSLWGFGTTAAGDLNGDGFADLVVGALYFRAPEEGEGNVVVFHGVPGTLSGTPTLIIDNPEDRVGGFFGHSVD